MARAPLPGLHLLSILTEEEHTFATRWWDPQLMMSTGVMQLAAWLRVDEAMYSLGLDRLHILGTPLVSDGHLAFYLVASTALIALWLVLHPALKRLWPAYGRIVPAHKQHYVLANLFKSAVLAAQASSFAWWFYSYYHYRCTANPIFSLLPEPARSSATALGGECQWDYHPNQGEWVKQVMTLYVTTDAVALLMVPSASMPTTTVIHHVSTMGLMLFCLMVHIADYPVAQKMMMYGFWSTLAWPVNLFLALRVVYPFQQWVGALARLALVVYVVSCLCNWTLQITDAVAMIVGWEGHSATVGTFVWLLFQFPLVRDDLVLMRWLFRFDPRAEQRKAAARGSKKAD